MYIKDSKSGEELDDVPYCRKEDGGSECTVGEKLHCMYRTKGATGNAIAEVPDVFKGKPGKTKAIKHFIHTADSSL